MTHFFLSKRFNAVKRRSVAEKLYHTRQPVVNRKNAQILKKFSSHFCATFFTKIVDISFKMCYIIIKERENNQTQEDKKMTKGKAVAVKRGIYFMTWIDGLFDILYTREEIEKRAEQFGIKKEDIEWQNYGYNRINFERG